MMRGGPGGGQEEGTGIKGGRDGWGGGGGERKDIG